MYTMAFDIRIGKYKLCMIDKVEIHRSVELLADTAVITLPASEYNKALQIEDKLHRGDKVIITLGYKEPGLETEFEGWLQRISTDGGNVKLHCEDDLFPKGHRKRGCDEGFPQGSSLKGGNRMWIVIQGGVLLLLDIQQVCHQQCHWL